MVHEIPSVSKIERKKVSLSENLMSQTALKNKDGIELLMIVIVFSIL